MAEESGENPTFYAGADGGADIDLLLNPSNRDTLMHGLYEYD